MKIFLLFYMCHFAMGLTHCYKTTVFLNIYYWCHEQRSLQDRGGFPNIFYSMSQNENYQLILNYLVLFAEVCIIRYFLYLYCLYVFILSLLLYSVSQKNRTTTLI